MTNEWKSYQQLPLSYILNPLLLLNGTQTLDEHIRNKKEAKQEVPDLFSEQESKNDNQTIGSVLSHLIDNYTIFANGNYSGVEFCLPQV
jgi:hypothetical protein